MRPTFPKASPSIAVTSVLLLFPQAAYAALNTEQTRDFIGLLIGVIALAGGAFILYLIYRLRNYH